MSSQHPAESSLENSRWLRVSKDSADPFPKTRWTMVRRVSSAEAAEAGKALNELCSIYWYPIYVYVRRMIGAADDAEDLTQGYLAHLLERSYISRADQEKGKFRAFLLADLKLFLSNEVARKRALKRGGGRIIESFDQALAERRYNVEPLDQNSPDQLFDKAWATTLLDKVRENLRGYYVAKGREKVYELLQQFLAWNAGDQSYAEVAELLGKSLSDVKVSVSRMRKKYRELLEAEISDTVASKRDIEEEIRILASLFS